MFSYIGKKIMRLAKLCVFAMPAVTLLVFFVMLSTGSRYIWLCLFVGVLLSILAWPLYGFGQLVQDVHDLHLSLGHSNLREDDLPHL